MVKHRREPSYRGSPTDRTPAFRGNPDGRQIGARIDPSSFDREKIAWQLAHFDVDGRWGMARIGQERWFRSVFPKLCNLETMTWAEIQRASGGRSHGNNSHFVPVEDLSKEARDRLNELFGQIDFDELFSLRLQGAHRLYGIRDGRILKVIWFDAEHEVCPSVR